MRSLALRARWLFPVAASPLADATLTIEDAHIAAIGDASTAAHDLGNVAILPGLVNAHTHLELSDVAQPLGAPGVGLADWIRLVFGARSGRGGNDAVQQGFAELQQAGVTAVGDIVQPGSAEPESLALDTVRFLELIGPTRARAEAAIELARQAAARGQALSPHAPYTVHPALLDAAIRLSAAERVPLAFHLAESREELQLLRDGSGPLRALLDERNAWTPELAAPGTRPFDYLKQLATAHRTLVIHGNYLDAEEIAFLAAHRERMAVVYCPRTHDWFAHGPYPLAQMLSAGCTVALGTDSRASTPSLSLFDELRTAVRKHPQLTAEQLLALATRGGAQALGWAETQGTLEPGKLANLTIVALPRRSGEPYDLLFDTDTRVLGRFWHGRSD